MATGNPPLEAATPEGSPPSRRARWRGWRLLWLVLLGLLLFVVMSDLFGWAYLRKPVAAFLSARLERQVEIDPPFSIHLRRSIPIRLGAVRIAAPDWSEQPHFADIANIEADLDWGFLAGRQPLLHRLAVERADIRAERDGQGRATWAMGGEKDPDADDAGPMLPVIEQLSIGQATIDLKDAANRLDVQIEASARDGAPGPGTGPASGDPQAAAEASGGNGLQATGKGKWRDEPVSFELRTKGLQPVLEGGALKDLEVKARLKATDIAFNGSLSALAATGDIAGTVSAAGPSLAELTIIPGLTLPSTPPYRLEGDLERSGSSVKVDVRRAEVGSSSMVAKLEYDGGGATPMLRGSLSASRLVLQDLGPSIGTSGEESAAAGRGAKGGKGEKGEKGGKGGKEKARLDAKRGKEAGRTGTGPGRGASGTETASRGKDTTPKAPDGARLLPSREFNLPSLRAMNADVGVDLQKLDLGTDALRPLRSLKTRLLLEGGRLTLQDLKSNVGGGAVTGAISLDGSSPDAAPTFDSKLKWDRVDLKSWVAVSDDFLVAGRFSGETNLKGSGKSTAAILQSLGGTIKGNIDGGSVSHQIVELAGLDAGQALGVLFSGDKPLELSCALIDLAAEKGTLRSNLFLFNTPDTIFFVQGGVNFRNEELDLRLVQSPKDWSPLSLRSPITIRGTLADPSIGVEPVPVALKVLSSVVLGAITPIAALIPLIEPKDNESRAGCGPAIAQVKKKAAELSPKAAPGSGDEGSPPKAPKDDNGNLRRPGRVVGERP